MHTIDRDTSQDVRQRFLFEDYDVRGEIISLRDTVAEVCARGAYALPLRIQLGEFLAAAGLISANLKSTGSVTVQARGDGPVPLLMADCTDRRWLRAIARPRDPTAEFGGDLRTLAGQGHLSVTVALPNRQRHQGIAPLDHPSLAACLSEYFCRSEQLPTRLWLAADGDAAAGLLLQALPAQRRTTPAARAQTWEHLTALADTLTPAEQLQLRHEDILHRLFHQERVRLFDPVPVGFGCSCSPARIGSAVVALGADTLAELFAATPVVETQCQFCLKSYCFTPEQLSAQTLSGGASLH